MPEALALPDAAGADVGSTLAKLVLPGPESEARCETLPADPLAAVAARLAACAPAWVGLTGAGAPRLARLLDARHRHFEESEAWAAGARAVVAAEVEGDSGAEPFLLVSVGTGTSIIRVDPDRAVRVGGTALGGGTLLGLGRRLAGAVGFEDLSRLAARGDRGRVDLRIGDVYGEGEAPLPAQATASAFAKLARSGEAPRREDLAAAVVGLVGENAGLLCMAHAGAQGVSRIVFGGSALTGNEALAGLLRLVCLAFGARPHFPAQGPYLGALGARALVRAGPAPQAGPTR